MSVEGFEDHSKDQLNGALALHPTVPPLRVDEAGAIRVGNSRVTLDVVVENYENGMTPEGIVRVYDSLTLPDVYGAIAYYLQHQDEVRVYLKRREREAVELQAKIEAGHPPLSRQQLLSRRPAGLAETRRTLP